MSIMYFKTDWQAKLYIESRCTSKEEGAGSEGTCYLGKDGKVYKIIDFHTEPYDIQRIITEEDIKLQSFAFPEELYVVEDKLKGYRTRRVKEDMFGVDYIFDIENIANIDFAAVAQAYKRMLIDIVSLSNKRILIFDLPFNIMFDGNIFTAIDTCGYKRVDYDPLADNVRSLNLSMENLFKLWLASYKEVDLTIKGTDIDTYLQELKTYIPPEIEMDRFFNLLENDIKER